MPGDGRQHLPAREEPSAAVSGDCVHQAHHRENIALSDAAATLRMHPNSFCRFFKENTGVTYLNYLNEYRLSKVYEDLVTTDVALHEVLEKHGFTNYKLFRHMFAERFHTTPGRMREELR